MSYKSPFIYLIVLCLFVAGCEDAAKDDQYGNELIYMPQANKTNDGNSCYNLSIKKNDLSDTSIVIGIYRSGMAPLEEFTVDLVVDPDTLAEAIAYASTYEGKQNPSFNIYNKSHLLPEQYYTIPDKITLPSGKRDTWTYLKINRSLLFSDPLAKDQLFVLPVRIQNPTKYKLNEKLSLTMVVIERK